MFRTFVGFTILTMLFGLATEDANAADKGQRGPDMIFKKLDTNNDGKLSKDELSNMGKNLAKGKAKGKGKGKGDMSGKLMERLDTNKDGELSLDEFKKLADLVQEKKDQ